MPWYRDMHALPSQQVDASIANHLAELPELTNGAKVLAMTHATRESLTEAWKHWVEEAACVLVCVHVGVNVCM
eukprot:1161354-Pelagomonas_calceolata.AAC.5